MLFEKMSGQLKQAPPHNGFCVRGVFLITQPACSYLYVPRWAQPRARQKTALPVEKLTHRCARLSRRAISKCQNDSQATSTEERIREQTARHSTLLREVSYLQKMVDTLRRLPSEQAKVRHCPVRRLCFQQ